MPNLSIKDVPESLAEALRQRATRNHRSLQGELMSIIESAVAQHAGALFTQSERGVTWPNDPENLGTVIGYGDRGRPIILRGTKTVQEIAASLRAQFPDPVDSGPNSVDIIRAARDSR